MDGVKPVFQTPPDVVSRYEPGIYYVDQDVPQGGVRMGLRTVRRDDPDIEAMEVMNYILGGGGFSVVELLKASAVMRGLHIGRDRVFLRVRGGDRGTWTAGI